MSVKIMGAVWDADLPRDEKFILLSYADHAAHDGTSIYPSTGRTAWKTGYTTRSVQTITKKLRDRRILIPDGRGWHGTNRYRLDVAALPQRKGYKEGEEFSPRKKQQEGMKKTTKEGEEFSPNPSLNINESSLVENATPADSPLAPKTPTASKMFTRLTANARAKGRRGPKRFPSLECMSKFDTAAEALNGEFDKALTKALEQGITSVTGVTNYISKWAANLKPRHLKLGA